MTILFCDESGHTTSYLWLGWLFVLMRTVLEMERPRKRVAQEKELVSQYSFLGHVLAKRSAQGLKNGAIASGEPWDAKEWEDFLTG